MKHLLTFAFVLSVAIITQPASAQSTDATRPFLDNGYAGGTVTIKGRITDIPDDIPPEYRDKALALRFTTPLDNYEGTVLPLRPDSTGCFEVRVELANTTLATLVTQLVVLEPGHTYEVAIRGYTYTFKGDDTLLNTELAAHPIADFKWDTDLMESKTDAEALYAAKAEIARLDSLEAYLYADTPTLSLRYRTLRHSHARAQAAYHLVQRRYITPDVRQNDGALWAYIRMLLDELPRPYTLCDDLAYTLTNYVSGRLEPDYCRGLNLPYIRLALDMAEERYNLRSDTEAHGRMQRINKLRTLLDDYERILPTATDSLLRAHPAYAQSLSIADDDPVLGGIVRSNAVYERQKEQRLMQLPMMTDLPAYLREPALAAELYGMMQQMHVPLSPAMQDLTHSHLHNAYYKQQILQRSDHLASLAASLASATEAECLMPNEPFEGMTDGAEIWAKIAEPLQGRVVFVDVWGTWCAPCRADLKNHTQVLHRTLADLPVTYIYLCNRSTDEAWRSCIAEYGLVLPHTLHYNLPLAQQAALQKHLQVESYPTYILFRPDGTRATTPDQEPRPYDPQSVRRQVERLLEK